MPAERFGSASALTKDEQLMTQIISGAPRNRMRMYFAISGVIAALPLSSTSAMEPENEAPRTATARLSSTTKPIVREKTLSASRPFCAPLADATSSSPPVPKSM